MSPEQLALDLTPVGAVTVGTRVRVRKSDRPGYFASRRPGREGVVTAVRPPCVRGPGRATWLPVLVLLDGDEPGREYAFEHDELEAVDA